jgi:pilus assembly protein Flp/PilA
MKTYLRKIVAFINDEEGAAAIEYALLLVMVALAIIGVAATLGTKIADVFTAVDTAMVVPAAS